MAIGECGLDFNRNFRRRKSRNALLLPSYALPQNKHAGIYALSRCPRAVYDIAGPWLDKLPGAVLHCFTGTREGCRRAWRVEFISALPVGFAMTTRTRAAGTVAVDSGGEIADETDAPYLLPRDLTPKPSSRPTSQPICPIFCNELRTGVEKCRMAGCHHGCQCQNTVWDCV